MHRCWVNLLKFTKFVVTNVTGVSGLDKMIVKLRKMMYNNKALEVINEEIVYNTFGPVLERM